jgi:hypothetical protein
MKEYMTMQRVNFEKYVEVNREFGSRLPEIKDITSVVELQREYTETMWAQAKEAVEAQTELLKGALVETRDALKVAYTFEEAEKPKAKAKAKPKAKAKKTAEAA